MSIVVASSIDRLIDFLDQHPNPLLVRSVESPQYFNFAAVVTRQIFLGVGFFMCSLICWP